MVSKILIVAVALFCLSSFCHADEDHVWSECSSETGSLVDVELFCKDDACPLKRNQNASIAITFKSNVHSEKVKAIVFGDVFGTKSPFVLPEIHSCEDVGFKCPIEAGGTYTYRNSIFVRPAYPRITLDVQWEIHDDQGKIIACVLVPAKII